jgi:hypothetical protein
VSVAHCVALERALAELIRQFQDAPDLFLREADLHAAAFAALEREPLLRARYATRDGRWTSLLHRDYPPLLAYELGLMGKDEGGRTKDPQPPSPLLPNLGEGGPREMRATVHPSSFILHPYDIVLLDPGFVRAYELKTVANADPRCAAELRALPPGACPRPLLAAVNLALVDLGEGLKPIPAEVLAELEADFLALVRSEADAERAYMGVFCRHWDMEGPARLLLRSLERWAAEHRRVSLVFLQAYRDDVGRVSGGRYFNLWSHMAPLLPPGSYQ